MLSRCYNETVVHSRKQIQESKSKQIKMPRRAHLVSLLPDSSSQPLENEQICTDLRYPNARITQNINAEFELKLSVLRSV